MNDDKITRVMSQTDAEIADLVASQPAEITVVEQKQYNQWELPPECQEREGKEYKYRWLSKDKRMLEKRMYEGWAICNSVNSPYIKSLRFGNHGAIERHGHLLGCMPLRKAQELKKADEVKSTEAVKYYTEDIKKQDPRFYDAKLSPEDSKDDPDFK